MSFLNVIKRKCRSILAKVQGLMPSRGRSRFRSVGYNIILVSPYDTEEKRRVGRALLDAVGMGAETFVDAADDVLVKIPLRKPKPDESGAVLYNLTGFQSELKSAVVTRMLLGMTLRDYDAKFPVTDYRFDLGASVCLCVVDLAGIPLLREALHEDFQALQKTFKRIVFIGVNGEKLASWEREACAERRQIWENLLGESLIEVSPESQDGVSKIVAAMDACFFNTATRFNPTIQAEIRKL